MNRITKRNYSSWLFLLIFYNVAFGVFWWFYTKGNVIYYWDGGFPLNPFTFLQRYTNFWNAPGFPGGPEFGFVAYIPIAVLEIPFYLTGIPIGIIQWIIVQGLLNISLFGYLSLFKFLNNNIYLKWYDFLIIALINLFYTLNYYTIGLSWVLGEIPPLVLYYFTPLLLYLYIKFLISTNYFDLAKNLLFVSVLGIFGVLYELQTSTLYFLILILIIGLIVKVSLNLKLYKIIIKTIIYIITLIVSGIYLLFYFIGSSLGSYATSFTYFGNKPIILAGLSYTYSTYNFLTSAFLYYPLFKNNLGYISDLEGLVIFIFIFFPILFYKVKSYSSKLIRNFYLGFVLLLLILLALQSGIINLITLAQSPLVRLPILGIFFVGITYAVQPLHIGYIIFTSISIILLLIYTYFRNIKKFKHFITILLVFMLLFNFVSYSYIGISHISTSYYNPIVNNSSETIINTFNCPKWFEQAMMIISNSDYNNVVLLPIQNALSWSIYYDNTRSAANVPAISDYFLGEVLSNAATSPLVYLIANIPSFNYTNFTNYLKILGVKYVILNKAAYPGPGTIARPWTDLPGAFPWNFTQYEYYLNETYGLKYVGTYGPYVIYEIEGDVPLVYASTGIPGNFSYDYIFQSYATGKLIAIKESLINNLSAPLIENIKNVNLEYHTVNNDEVIIKIHSNVSFYLIFDQGFSNLWILEINGNINHNHYIANGYANAWLMPAGNYTAVIKIKYAETLNLLYIISFLLIIFSLMSILIFKKKERL